MHREVNLECSNKERVKMKVQKSQEKVFTPISITLTIESEKEYEVLRRLFHLESSVPRYVYGDNEEKGRLLSSLMKRITKVL